MSIVQSATTSFKVELLQAVHSFGPTSPDTFKIALYTALADLNQSTTIYTTTNEVSSSGTNYTAGGNTLVISQTPVAANNSINVPTAYVSFVNSSWPLARFTARCALIYNFTEGNKSVAVLDFGSDKVVNGDTFTVTFPTPDANSAIVRIS